MSGLKFSADPSPSLPDKQLGSPDVGPSLVGGTIGFDGSQTIEGVKFGFGITGNAEITAFNSPDDKDKDGVIGIPVVENDTFQVVFPPQIALTESDAWLKYRCSAKLSVSVAGTVAPIAFKLDASKQAVFTDFHLHRRTDNARVACAADVTRLRFAGSSDDVLSLGPKEALSYQVRGELSASVTLSWSDVFTATLGSLGGILSSGNLLKVQISPAASATFHVGLVDDFRVVFTKTSGGDVRVAVMKSNSREIGVGVALGVTVKWADEAAISTALSALFNSIAGKPVEEVDRILAHATLSDLTPLERDIATRLARTLGLGEVLDSLQDLKTRWNAFKEKVSSGIDQIAKAKVALGFSYDYLRTRTEDTLLIAELDAASFRNHHGDLMLCDFIGLLEFVKGHPSSLKKYLNQETLTRSRAWGFSLGIGPWNIGGKDKKELTKVVQHNINGDERIAYHGLRGYHGDWIGETVDWNADFKAEMPGFSPAGTATTCDFDYGLHLKWLWKQNSLSATEMREYLDFALIWRVVTQDNVDTILETLNGQFGKNAQVSLEMTFDNETFRQLLPMAAAEADGDLIVRALAKSMPYNDMFAGRRFPKFRELLYAPLWKDYFQSDSRPINSYPPIAGNTIARIAQEAHIPDGPGLAAVERGTSTTPAFQNPTTFSGLIDKNGSEVNQHSDIHKNWKSFASGLKALDLALTPHHCASHKAIEDVFKNLSKFWGQSLYVRAAGAFLIDVASTDVSLIRKANRVMTVTVTGGDTFVFSGTV